VSAEDENEMRASLAWALDAMLTKVRAVAPTKEDSMLEQQRCSSCRARILWAISEASGKPIPLDAEPTEKGNIVVVNGTVARYVRAAERATIAAQSLYVSHFATCPNAAQHRRAVPR
jgi:hypothetical protein